MKAQELYQRFRDEAQHAWHHLADQLHHLEQRNNHALVPFEPFEESTEEEAQGNNKAKHSQWGLIPVDMYEVDDVLMVSMEIPGMEASSICISVDGNELIISGEKRMPEERLHASRDITREMAFGKFERRITLTGHRLKKTENDASYKDGVLTVSLPYDGTEQLRTARTIPVQ